jgi:TRAP transporter TAXI family solute receptor
MKPDSGRIQRQQRGIAGIAVLSLLVIAVVALGVFATYQFVDPAPPDKIVLATGADGGAYQRYGDAYVARLADAGIDVVLRDSAGSAQNLEWIRSETDVDIAFVQSGLATASGSDEQAVMALGSLYMEPLWLFVRDGFEFEKIPDLSGARIDVGAEGSGTRAIVLRLLEAHGIGDNDVTMLALPRNELVAVLDNASIDAAFVIGDPTSETVNDLVRGAGARLVSLDRAATYARRYPYLKLVTLPAGMLDLEDDLPPYDVQTVATTAMLVARNDLHPALVDLLLVAATDIHGGHGLLADSGTFPSPHYVDFPLSEEAERHFRRGPPFLMRYLPFWAATLVDRLWVMLLPLLGLAIPLFKLVPPAYQWQVRRRFLRLYAELEKLDPSVNSLVDDADLDQRIERINWLEGQTAVSHVPREYKDAKYKLRRDIDLVRRQLVSATGSGPTGLRS